MYKWKSSFILAAAVLGLFSASTARADEHFGRERWTYAEATPRYAPAPRFGWAHGHRGRFQVPSYAQPIYTQPAYEVRSAYPQPVVRGCVGFTEQVRSQLDALEDRVRMRVMRGELDGYALTTLEEARDDLLRDMQNLAAKGYFTEADHDHVERDLQQLHARLGC